MYLTMKEHGMFHLNLVASLVVFPFSNFLKSIGNVLRKFWDTYTRNMFYSLSFVELTNWDQNCAIRNGM